MKDLLGDRMKGNYEDRTRYKLPRRTYCLIRIDGKSFHTYTRHLQKPVDIGLIAALNEATIKTCKQIQGCQFAFVQSDEISFLLTDFAKPTSDAWFDYNLQKMASVSASLFTAYFNQIRLSQNCHLFAGLKVPAMSRGAIEDEIPAFFDSRIFTIPDRTEVANYFIWRQKDAIRNHINTVAQSIYSHKELHEKPQDEVKKMLEAKNIDLMSYGAGAAHGRIIKKVVEEKQITLTKGPDTGNNVTVNSSKFVVDAEIPVFVDQRGYLEQLIPEYPKD